MHMHVRHFLWAGITAVDVECANVLLISWLVGVRDCVVQFIYRANQSETARVE